MMEKTYILENGILEQYVLGELNQSEQQQIADALKRYPELDNYLKDIENTLEKIGFENAVDVPNSIKIELLSKINKKEQPAINLHTLKRDKSFLAVAASIAGLLLVVSVYLYFELKEIKGQLQLVEDNNSRLSRTLDDLNSTLAETNKWYNIINDPETEKYILIGNELMPGAKVISYVNDAKKSVVISAEALPELDEQHDYQMWADVDGVMINMGVIDASENMLVMNYIDRAESLNITIEPAGGSDHPNVSQLVTNIYLK